MSLISDEGISLRRSDYSETSQVIVLLTRGHGKVRVIAKGARRSTRRKFATGIDLLERGDVVFTHRADRAESLANLVEWKQRELYAGLRQELLRLYGAQYLAEVTPGLLEDGDPHPGLFEALAKALTELDRESRPLASIVRYQQALLTEVGLGPDLWRCTSCGGQADVANQAPSFSAETGGLICRDCEPAIVEKRASAPSALHWLRGGAKQAADAGTQAAAFDLLNYHIGYTLGREPKLANYVVPAAQRRGF